MADLIRVTLKRSLSKLTDRQRATLQGLGLRKRQQTRVVLDTPANRGMILKMQHMLDVEAFTGDDALRKSTRRTRAAQNGKPGGRAASAASEAGQASLPRRQPGREESA